MSANTTRICLVVLSLIVSILPVSIPSYASPEGASIRIANPRGHKRILDVEFSEEDLKRVQEDARFIIQKLRESGAKCCEPRAKLSDRIWECCDGSQIRTDDPILVKALNELGGDGD